MILSTLLSLALAGTPDYVYLYGNKGNRGFDCNSPHFYVENVEPGSLLGLDCVQVLTDALYWPTDLDSTPMVLVLDGVGVDRDDCRFVAHARAANRNTSTVLDCRSN